MRPQALLDALFGMVEYLAMPRRDLSGRRSKMKAYVHEPLTPRMLIGLRELSSGKNLDFATTSVGRPTKQRLAKFGLATFDIPKDWDGPMCITFKGLRVLEKGVAAL
jgi:hypothetical protein